MKQQLLLQHVHAREMRKSNASMTLAEQSGVAGPVLLGQINWMLVDILVLYIRTSSRPVRCDFWELCGVMRAQTLLNVTCYLSSTFSLAVGEEPGIVATPFRFPGGQSSLIAAAGLHASAPRTRVPGSVQQAECAVSVHAANLGCSVVVLFGSDVAFQGVLGPVKRCSSRWIGLLIFNT